MNLSARVLLLLWRILRGTVCISASIGMTGCLIPPDGKQPAPDAIPPYVDLSSLEPNSLVQIDAENCPQFAVAAQRIFDDDSETLLFRWVANNRLDRTRLINDDPGSTKAVGTPHATKTFVFPREQFSDQVVNNTTGILSLFITDAAAWIVANPSIASGAPQDLGGIVQPEDPNAARASVIEIRWAFSFVDGVGDCPL